MKILKIKEIVMKEDNRKSNILEKDNFGKPIKYKQSKCTCHIILKDTKNNEYDWVAENESLSEAIKQIAENEDKKYDIENKPWLLGRNMFFLSYLYDIYENYLKNFGFNPPEKDLEKARRFKYGKFKN